MKHIQAYSPQILILFHAIGIALFLWKPEFAELTYLNILLCAFLVVLSEQMTLKFAAVVILLILLGYSIEHVGVHTGMLFGSYSYGSALGPKIDEIPAIIGFNWLAIVISSASLARLIISNRWTQIILAAVLCTLLDFLIEPVAIKFDFWSWNQGTIPVFNYLCWFGFSLIFSALYLGLNQKRNQTATALWGIWALFFVILNFFA